MTGRRRITAERMAELKRWFMPVYEAPIVYELLDVIEQAEKHIVSLEKGCPDVIPTAEPVRQDMFARLLAEKNAGK